MEVFTLLFDLPMFDYPLVDMGIHTSVTHLFYFSNSD